jgi:hypothetical protein
MQFCCLADTLEKRACAGTIHPSVEWEEIKNVNLICTKLQHHLGKDYSIVQL